VGVLLSMTGYGEARYQSDALTLSIELRSVNNRYLKLVLRATEPYNLLEAEFEKVVRRFVRRGTVQVFLRCDRPRQAHDYRINNTAILSYIEQLQHVSGLTRGSVAAEALIGQVLSLPGVAVEPGASLPPEEEWPQIEQVLAQALERLQQMRREEGARMAEELLALRGQVVDQLNRVRERLPAVVEGYRDRIHERVKNLLAGFDVQLDAGVLIREVAIFAERSDIAEEVVRLESHLEQFEQIVRRETDSPGRKLEFVVQEMGREANTIGSKASDVAISRHVVEIKAALEKIRELIQNVE
jgi:uncharacterized protein (TIGR00255 family)